MTCKFVKHFTGKNMDKRFFGELFFNRLFNEFTPQIIDVDKKLRSIFFKKIKTSKFSYIDSYNIGKLLATVHNRCCLVIGVWPQNIMQKYKPFPEIDSQLSLLQKEIKKIRVGFIHGDFRLRNILKDGQKLLFTDWEYAGINFVYWDLAIFIGDLRHQQYHKKHLDLSVKEFLNGYSCINHLTKNEIRFIMKLGGYDIVLDHLSPEITEKNPIPATLFKRFNAKEEKYLLDANIM